jgi:DNA sulfur modification protein DndB
MSSSFYTFPALRGRQGEHDYYILLCPLHLTSRIFVFDGMHVPANWQPRPSLDPGKVERLANLIQTHPDGYVIAPLVATVTTPVEFVPFSEAIPELGSVKIPLRAVLVIQDG